jgi:hypothetical protein
MWQITYMLSLLPDWFWTLVLIAGILGVLAAWVLKFIPFVSTYRLPIQVGSILLLLVGVYFQGVIANEAKYKAEHERLSALIAKQEAEFKVINAELSQLQAERDAAIADRGKKSKETITRWLKGDPVEIVKEVNLSDAERKVLEDKIKELQKAEKECKVPALLIEELNKNAVRPPKEDKK